MQTEGFFVECGAYDGEWLSNTLYIERNLNWSGLLIEADPTTYNQLITRRRNAYTLPNTVLVYLYKCHNQAERW